MEKTQVNVFDILTEDEKERLEDYKEAIIEARTLFGIQFNLRRANKLIDAAKERYKESLRMASHS